MWQQSSPASLDRVTSLAVFARVVDTRSFTAAARELGSTTSAVSKRIARLEDGLGVRLLHRTTRRLSLTDAGRALYEHASRIVAEVEGAELAVLKLGSEVRGLLRLSASVDFGVSHVAPLLAAFVAVHPEVHVDLALSDRYVDLVDEGFDMAVRIGRLADSALVARKLGETRGVLCASPAYLRTRGTPSTPDELAAHECIRYAYGNDEWRFVGDDAPRPVRGRLRFNNGGAVRAAAEAGAGIAFLPEFIAAEGLAAGRLRAILAPFVDRTVGIYAVSPPGRAPMPTVRALTAYLADALPKRLSEPRRSSRRR